MKGLSAFLAILTIALVLFGLGVLAGMVREEEVKKKLVESQKELIQIELANENLKLKLELCKLKE